MRRPRAGDDNGDDRYGVRVDEPRRHLSSPLLLFSPSPSLLPSSSLLPCLLLLPSPSSPPPPPFSFFFFLLPFFSFLLSFLLFLLPPHMMSWFVNTIRDDVLQTFSNFYHRICM